MDIIGGIIPKRTVSRAFAIGLFIALLFLFRKLLILLVFFVVFERLIGVPAKFLATRTRLPYKVSVIGMAVSWLAVFGGGVTFGVVKAVDSYKILRTLVPEKIASIKNTAFFHSIESHFDDAGGLVERAQHYASGAIGYIAALGHVLVFATIAFIFAVVYLLEKEEIEGFLKTINPRSLLGRLTRWFGFVVEAIAVTLQFQVVVALFNAITTYPVLLVIGIPNATALMFGIFLSGLIPVVGNFAVGIVLTIMAYQAKGWIGVVVFTILTFLLGKVESYYLSPKLAQRHVRLPSFVLLVSLVIWEHLIGFAGLLVSFPVLFVIAKIRADFKVSRFDPALENAMLTPQQGAPSPPSS